MTFKILTQGTVQRNTRNPITEAKFSIMNYNSREISLQHHDAYSIFQCVLYLSVLDKKLI